MNMDIKTLRLILAIFLIVGSFGIAAVDYFAPGPDTTWKTVVLGTIYGIANIVLFVFK